MTKQVAIVTGAGRGIGAATAMALAREGWQVAVVDIDGAAARQIAREIGGLAIGADVGEPEEVGALVEDVRDRLGRIDAIVSNAGISRNGPLADTTIEDWNRVLAVNLSALFYLAKFAEADLRASKGAIVAIASTRAHQSEPNTLAYSATKGGIVALTHALAMTLGPDVRVNCISPGWIDTGKHGPLSPADHAQHPAGRVGQPGDIAEAVTYLLSDKAGFITGADLIVDGGMTRKMIYV